MILCEGDRAHPYLAFPLALERFLVEGSYHKVRAQSGGHAGAAARAES